MTAGMAANPSVNSSRIPQTSDADGQPAGRRYVDDRVVAGLVGHDAEVRPGRQVGHHGGELRVGPRAHRAARAQIELFLGHPALAVGGLEHVHGPLPVGRGGEHPRMDRARLP